MIESWLQDARYAVRLLRKSPVFTATAALSLAIGIGANATIFSVASALLLRPLPGLADAGRLIDIGRTTRGRGFDTVSYPTYLDVRARTTTMSGVYAHRLEPEAMSLSEHGNAERIYGSVVTANYFEVLGTRPRSGRLLHDADDRVEGGSPVAVISSRLFERRFAADPSTIGRTITLNGHPFTVVGVAPPGFQGATLLAADVWMPITAIAQAVPRIGAGILRSRGSVWLVMGGRLKDGVALPQAHAEMQAIGAALSTEHPRDAVDHGLVAAPTSPFPGQVQVIAGFLGLLMAIVGIVLLIACVNVAGMLLARGAARQREIAIRLAAGAGRGRLVRQLLTETLVLFAAGTALGLALSTWLTSLLLALLPQLPVPVSLDIRIDWRVTLFAIGVSLGAAVLCGLAPALQASRADLVPALRSEGLGGPSKLRLRNAFVVGQVALSLVLIVAAGLFLRALHRASSIDPGFDETRVDVVSLDLAMAGYTAATSPAFVQQLLERARGGPGVDAASAAIDLPLDGGRFGLGGLRIPGVEPPQGRESLDSDWNVVAPGYFETLRLPLLAGRDFTGADTPESMPVAIVNQAFVDRFWPGQEGLSRRVEQVDGRDGEARWLTIVGVTADAKLVSLGTPAEPMIYVAFAQQPMTRVNIVVRRAGEASAIPQIRALVREMNPVLPVTEALPMSDVTALGTVPQRIAATVAGSLGLFGLLLAGIGIYGVTAYAVSSRTREIGIRMALGADRGRVMALVLRQALVLAGVGIAIGLAMAAGGTRFLDSLLFGVPAIDPLTFGGASALFAAITMAACYIPARRAAAVNPIVALRND